MHLVRIILAVLLLLVGGTFALQGFNVLPGSLMTGQPEWAIIGSVMVFAGLGLAVVSLRRKAP